MLVCRMSCRHDEALEVARYLLDNVCLLAFLFIVCNIFEVDHSYSYVKILDIPRQGYFQENRLQLIEN